MVFLGFFIPFVSDINLIHSLDFGEGVVGKFEGLIVYLFLTEVN